MYPFFPFYTHSNFQNFTFIIHNYLTTTIFGIKSLFNELDGLANTARKSNRLKVSSIECSSYHILILILNLHWLDIDGKIVKDTFPSFRFLDQIVDVNLINISDIPSRHTTSIPRLQDIDIL